LKPGILIVDDSLTVRMDLSEAFDAAGFASTLCATAAEARKAIASGSFALMVLDILLPDGDGIDLLREIRSTATTAETPVLLLSSEADVRDRIRGLKTGADEYVGKPYDRSHVVSRARELLRTRQPEVSTTASNTVLLIDDSRTFREELKSALESSGYAVVTAETGEEGLRAAVDVRPAAIIVDGVMPGIDGPTVIRRLRADTLLRRTPCILLTASGVRSGELAALDAGADAYVRKEDDIEVILARVAAVMRSSHAPAMVGPASSLLGPKRILAVDDSPTYLQEVADQLRQEGYDVVLARSGEEALELLAVQQVDCILLDLLMPGLSGQDTCRRIKASAAWRDIPLIMHTALENQEAMIEGINAGADDYVAKSSEFEVLRARLRAQLRRRQFEDENRSIREQLQQKELEAVAARAARELTETRAALIEELEHKNRELEAFSYSVSHDLRAPLRSIDGFSQSLLEDYAGALDEKGQDYLRRVRRAAQRMGELIDALLELSRVGRAELHRERVDLSTLARAAAAELGRSTPERRVRVLIPDSVSADADPRLLRIVLENLLGNAWKFTKGTPEAAIELGATQGSTLATYFVRDNGAGFSMTYAGKLFTPFQRLHSEAEFPGTGIGLATVHRIVQRHGGRVWAEGAVGKGATFFWTLPNGSPR
jgi:two-component system NtrC family sensor kinase